MTSRLKMAVSSLGLSVATVTSKLLGVIRDMMVAAVFGTGPLAEAWTIALIAPNMFRRIFGEGAVGTAMVPMLADSVAKKDTEYAALQLRTVMLTICGILLFIVALGMTIPIAIPYLVSEERLVRQGLLVAAIPATMPYAVFICLAGVATSALNVSKRFVLPGFASLLFNLTTIGFLAWYHFSGTVWNSTWLLVALCVSVTISGILQLAVILTMLKQAKLMAPIIFRNLPWRKTLSELWRLSFPALIGASVLQISMLIDWGLALYLGGYAVPALGFAEHVAFLPISAIALSLGVVGLSHMTVSYAEGKVDEMKSTLNFGLRYVLFLSIPLAVFTILFGESIVRVLFERGQFNDTSVAETVWALQFLAVGIPFFCLAKVTVAGFHSRKDMMTPVKVSLISTMVNVICGVSLMWTMRQGGLAVAMVVSSLIYNGALLFILRRAIGSYGFRRVAVTFLKTTLCAGLSAVVIWFAWPYLPAPKLFQLFSTELLPLFIGGVAYLVIFGILSILFKLEEMEPLMRRLRKRLPAGRGA